MRAGAPAAPEVRRPGGEARPLPSGFVAEEPVRCVCVNDDPTRAPIDADEHAGRYRSLTRRILAAAEDGRPREVFVGRALRLLLEDASASRVTLRLREHGEEVEYSLAEGARKVMTRRRPVLRDISEPMDRGWRQHFDPEGAISTRLGSVFACGERLSRLLQNDAASLPPHLRDLDVSRTSTVAWIPLAVSADPRAVLVLAREGGAHFERASTRLYEAVVQVLVVALDQQSARWALGERIKELTCLYRVARVAGDREIALGDALRDIAATLPPAMQHPALATARVVVEGTGYAMPGFREGPHRLVADIVAYGVKRGVVEVFYGADVEAGDEVFLREERALLGAVAGEAGRLVERDRATRERKRLEEQLRHADRLATIGTLAAGVAHELNEPLGGVLGLAQLAAKADGLPPAVAADLEKIVRAALHAREIVRKLVLFARHEPPRKAPIRFEAVVGEALDLLAARCAAAAVTIERDFGTDLPDVVADAAQVRQVVVNLVVNAIQAMPDGGMLRVRVAGGTTYVTLEVEDQGVGMDADTCDRIFTPFFTTKDVGEGTGLGLSVVHGIVSSHGGTIEVTSAPGSGSRFRVVLPARGLAADQGRS